MRHSERATGLRCSRCDRPFCPDCLREAPVGFHCVECVRGAGGPSPGSTGGFRPGRRRTRGGMVTGRTVAGAVPGGRPLAVYALIGLNVLVFAITVVQAGSVAGNAAAPLFGDWLLQPLLVAGGEWWRVFTAGFLHFGFIHLLFNMVALWVIGKDLEPVFGRVRFLAVYLVGLLGGSAAPLLFSSPGQQVAGASGAVFGLMGALAVVLRGLRMSASPAISLIAINLVLSFVVPNISIAGHLGGLVTGALAAAVLVHAPGRAPAWQAAGIAAIAIGLLVLIAARVALL